MKGYVCNNRTSSWFLLNVYFLIGAGQNFSFPPGHLSAKSSRTSCLSGSVDFHQMQWVIKSASSFLLSCPNLPVLSPRWPIRC